MQITINKNINYVEEANALLFHYVNGNTYEKMKAEGLKKSSYRSDIYDKFFLQIKKLSDYVIENLRTEKVQLEFYFKEIANSQMSLSGYLLPFYFNTKCVTLEDYDKAARSKSNAEIIKDFDNIFSQYCSIGRSGEERTVETLEEMMRVMDVGDLTVEDKCKIVHAYLDLEKHLDTLCSILGKVITLLKEQQSDIAVLENEFYEYWNHYIAENDFIKNMQEYANITWEYNKNGLIVLPSIFRPLVMVLNINDEEDAVADIIHIGILMDSDLSRKQNEVNADKLNNALKLLSDKSKFEILRYIKDKPAYGFEIANELNLSTSTISYHMNSLISAGLVKLDKDANKIYYRINKDTVNDLLEDIRILLL
ncbi:MAG: transcriptional regulator, ArsR family [Herbinix sp.]|nr:transcriptional regulator, ArsR family [Herbinix sp.]